MEKKLNSSEFFELVGLGALCLFVTYLLVAEVRLNKKCIPDHSSQEMGRCF